jgi:hypothetical protein
MEDVEPQENTPPEILVVEIPTDYGVVYAEVHTNVEPL